MNCTKLSLRLGVLMAVLIAMFLGTGATEAASPSWCGRWQHVSSPNADVLKRVAALSTNNVWAVGSYSDGSLFKALIDGRTNLYKLSDVAGYPERRIMRETKK